MELRTINWKIKSLRRDQPDTVRVRLGAPQLQMELMESLRVPGSFLTFSLPTEPAVTRSYSIIEASADFEVEFLTKRIRGGRGSEFFHQTAQEGDELTSIGIGNHIWDHSWQDKPQRLIGLAAGIGITPVYSILKHASPRSGQDHKLSLLYASPSRRKTILLSEIQKLQGVDVTTVYSDTPLLSSTGEGRLTAARVIQWLRNEPDWENATFLICGPHGFMKMVHEALDSVGIAAEQRRTEYFVKRPFSESLAFEGEDIADDARPSCRVEIEQDHGLESFVMHGEGKTILKAALDNGLEVPNACRGGICMACQATVLEGEVQRLGMSGLSEEEKSKGWILCCRSQPKSTALKLRMNHG